VKFIVDIDKIYVFGVEFFKDVSVFFEDIFNISGFFIAGFLLFGFFFLASKISNVHLVIFVDGGEGVDDIVIPIGVELRLDVLVFFGAVNDAIGQLGQLTHIPLFDFFLFGFINHEFHVGHVEGDKSE